MSEKDQGVEQIIKQAIRFEKDAYAFYIRALGMVKQPHIKDTLQDLADQEVEHKEKLQKLLEGDLDSILAVKRKIQDLGLAEYLVFPTLDEDATFQDVLGVAMHREKSSHDFYTAMAGIARHETAKKLFEFLAQEELVHKNKVETLYDEVIYREF